MKTKRYKIETVKGPFTFMVKTENGLKHLTVDDWAFAVFDVGQSKFMIPLGITTPNEDEIKKHNCGDGSKEQRDAAVDWHFHNNLNPVTRHVCSEIRLKRKQN